MSVLWEMRQNRKIRQAEADAAAGAAQASMMEGNCKHLAEQVEKLTTLCQALWSLLKEEAELEEEALLERFRQLQQEKVGPDGQPKTVPCPKCRRPMQGRQERCLYCGATRQATTAFETL